MKDFNFEVGQLVLLIGFPEGRDVGRVDGALCEGRVPVMLTGRSLRILEHPENLLPLLTLEEERRVRAEAAERRDCHGSED